MAIALGFHLLAAALWVGGLFFAYMILRPTLQAVDSPGLRLQIWLGVFGRFFPWVWVAIVALYASGFWMLLVGMGGGLATARHGIHLMLSTASLMSLLFAYLYFMPYRQFKQAVRAENYPAAARFLGAIRQIVAMNTVLGAATLVVAAMTRYA